MNSFKKSKALFLATILCFFQLTTTAAWAKSLLPQDPTYNFDPAKLGAAKDSFMFLRSFVDYYYLLIKANPSALPSIGALKKESGWCVGDAHPENFGILIQQDGKYIFSMNDMDDSGPCPVGLDLARLMVAGSLYNKNTKIGPLMDAYKLGVSGKLISIPHVINELIKKSQKRGTAPRPSKVSGNRLTREASMVEVTGAELKQVQSAVAVIKGALSPSAKLLDVVATSKTSGGSGGLLRYELLFDNGGSLLHLEMKEQVKPAVYPVATAEIPPTPERISKTLAYVQSKSPSLLYAVTSVDGRDMLIRPRFDGNIGVDLGKNSDSENQEIIRFEAYMLGIIHSESVADASAWLKQLEQIKAGALENDIDLIRKHFELKYSTLKK